MDVKSVNVYAACDSAIKFFNREILRLFGQLKTADLKKIDVVRKVAVIYRNTAKRARKRYCDIWLEAYELGLLMCGTEAKKASRMTEEADEKSAVDTILKEADPVTLYSFDMETERKIQRLAETLAVAQNPEREIDKAVRYWSQQLGQYAINVTDYAIEQAYADAGIDWVEWYTQRDGRVCAECRTLDGRKFMREDVPAKPHFACRCRLIPAKK